LVWIVSGADEPLDTAAQPWRGKRVTSKAFQVRLGQFSERKSLEAPGRAAAGHFSLVRTATIIALAAVLVGCNTRPAERWQIPDGYVGWIVVQYNNPSCAPLPETDGYTLLRVSPKGRLCTSDRQPNGEAFDKYEYLRGDGGTREIDQRTMVWGGKASSTGRSFVFVGTEQQFHAASDSAEELDRRCTVDLLC
jgi:hypothetical protein